MAQNQSPSALFEHFGTPREDDPKRAGLALGSGCGPARAVCKLMWRGNDVHVSLQTALEPDLAISDEEALDFATLVTPKRKARDSCAVI